MRTASRLGVIAITLALVAGPAVARMAFQDNKLNFKSCDGKNLTARWRSNNFHLSVPGKTLEPKSPELKYIGWDGKCRSMRVDANGQFQHTLGDATHADRLINYVSWDGTKWSATRAGPDFYKVRVADKSTSAPDQKQIMDAALWLKSRKPDSRAASRLASELLAASEK